MAQINNLCESIKVSYSKTPDEYYKQKITVLLTKEQLDAYNLHVREFEKEKLNGLDTHSILKEGVNNLDSNGLLQILFYFDVETDEQFKVYRNTIVQVSVS